MIHEPDAGGRRPLHDAAWTGPAAAVLRLLELGADPNVPGPRRLRAVAGAASVGAASSARSAAPSAAGSPPKSSARPIASARRITPEDGWTALHYACFPHEGKDLDVLRVLLEAGADPNAGDGNGRSALHLMASIPPDVRERLDPKDQWAYNAAALLIKHGADVNQATDARRYLNTPLHRAAFWGRAIVVALLLKNGAHPGVLDGRGLTPLDAARRGGDPAGACVTLLVAAAVSPV